MGIFYPQAHHAYNILLLASKIEHPLSTPVAVGKNP